MRKDDLYEGLENYFVTYLLFVFSFCLFPSIISQAAEKGIIFVGESHVSIASASVTPSQGGDNTLADYVLDSTLFFVFENSSDVGKQEWLEDTALGSVRGIIDSHESVVEWSIVIQHGATESMYPERWEKYIPIWQKFKDTFPESKVYVLSIPPLPENGRYWSDWVKANSLPEPFSKHDNEEVKAFNKFCEKNSPVPYLDFYAEFDGGQALEGSESTLDSPDTIDSNHFAPSVYRSVLGDVIKEIDSGSYISGEAVEIVDSDNPALEDISDNKVEDGNKGLLGYLSSLFKKSF